MAAPITSSFLSSVERSASMSSSLVRSSASLSLCRHRLVRCAARLGRGDAATRAPPALEWRRSFWASGSRRGDKEAGFSPWFRETSSAADAVRRPSADLQREQSHDRALSFFTWARLAIGSAVAVAAPFLHSKRASFLRIQSEVEMVKDAAETVAEVVENVAAAAEKVSSEVAEQLPEGGRLRRAVVLVEHASKEVAEEAHLARDIIHKVDEIEDDVEALIKPIVDHHGKHRK